MSHAFRTEIKTRTGVALESDASETAQCEQVEILWAARRWPRIAWYQSNAILTLTLLVYGKPRVDLVDEYVARS
jgi:hypothetical protein